MAYKRLFFCVCLLGFCLLCLCYPTLCLGVAGQAMGLWASSVVPALFPFGVAVSTLLALNAFAPLTRLLARPAHALGLAPDAAALFTASALSGYPMGAKLTAQLFAEGSLSRPRAQVLLSCISTAGPSFMVGSLASGMLGNAALAPYLLLPHYLSAFCLCLMFGRGGAAAPATAPAAAIGRPAPLGRPSLTLGQALGQAVTSTMHSLLTVCGFMAFYSVAAALLSHFAARFLGQWAMYLAPLLGLMELSTGCAGTDFLPLSLRLPVLSLLLGFGGLCVHGQTHAIAAAAGLTPQHFWIHKSIQGVLAMVLCALMLACFPLDASVCRLQLPLTLPIGALAALLPALLFTARRLKHA